MSTIVKKNARYLLHPLVLVTLVMVVIVAAAIFSSVATTAPPGAGNSALATAGNCAECHDDSTLITGMRTEWAESLHATGDAYLRGSSASCAGCHSGGAFSKMVADGLAPNQVAEGDVHPTRQDCRACHQTHTGYTVADWALETTAPVVKFAAPGTFDGGNGNLCANCHQGRRDAPVASGGVITGISSHWGPHHGPQSDMMLGIAGVTSSPGSPSGHYSNVENTCTGCHMGPNNKHTYEPEVSTCQACHTGATNFDINGRQTATQAQLDIIGAELVALGYLSSNDADGHPTTSSAPENIGNALWNWIYVAHEDGSLGVHNAAYTEALLDEACAQLGLSC